MVVNVKQIFGFDSGYIDRITSKSKRPKELTGIYGFQRVNVHRSKYLHLFIYRVHIDTGESSMVWPSLTEFPFSFPFSYLQRERFF